MIAIVDAYGYANAEADLAVYRSTYGLPACTTANGCFGKYNENGTKTSYPADNVGWAEETALDLDMASAMCPNCRIVLVEASSSSYADLGTAENVAARLGARVISNSYGGSEGGTQNIESAAYNPRPGRRHHGQQRGRGLRGAVPSLFAARHRGGRHQPGAGVEHARLERDGVGRRWQRLQHGLRQARPGSTDVLCTKRMEADVSAVADPSTGVAVYAPVSSHAEGWMVFGGTSVAAPLVGGIYAVNGGSASYGSNPYANTAHLNDVTAGSNGSCGKTYFCTAGKGYDGPTGLGTPIGSSAF